MQGAFDATKNEMNGKHCMLCIHVIADVSGYRHQVCICRGARMQSMNANLVFFKFLTPLLPAFSALSFYSPLFSPLLPLLTSALTSF